MSWMGYLSYDGNEIINVPRTLAYCRSAGITWVEDVLDSEHLAEMLGHEPYRYIDTPGQEAPWYNPNNLDSAEFFGIIPVSISGIDTSSRSAETIEFTVDGGTSGRMRYTTKTVVSSLILVGSTEAGVDYGRRYLASITSGRDCNGRTPENYGAELVYAKSEPLWEPDGGVTPQECWETLKRRLIKFRFNNGPEVTGRRTMSDGAKMWTVSLSGVAGDSFEYGVTTLIVDSIGDGGNPYAPGVTAGAYDNAGYEHVQSPCPQPAYSPLYDPLAPALIAPPGPPDLPVLPQALPTTWTRRYVEIPADLIDRWDDFQLSFSTFASANMRNIVYRVFETADFEPQVDRAQKLDYLMSFVPANSTFHADGVYRQAYVDQGGGIRRGSDSLLFGKWVKPVTYGGISCAKSYTVVIDTPVSTPAFLGAISLTGRTR